MNSEELNKKRGFLSITGEEGEKNNYDKFNTI